MESVFCPPPLLRLYRCIRVWKRTVGSLFLCFSPLSGGVGHDSQSVPEKIFARAHFHLMTLIKKGQASPRVEGDVEIM